jgi:fibronectin-binding autotransporter adhesin
VINNGTIDVTLTINGTATTTYSGIISNGPTNKISLVKNGTGTQILTANNTYTGPTTVSEGTLQLGNGGTTGSIPLISTITDNGTLAINHSNTMTQGVDFGLISGTGGFIQAGPGTTIFNLANTYNGATLVNAGTLVVSGTISGSTTVNSGGTLAGDVGTLGNVTINSGGTLSPGGGGTGSLTVNGNFVLEAYSNFNVQFDTGAGYVDAITLNGNLSITTNALLNVSDISLATVPIEYYGSPNEIITYSGTWNGGTFFGLSDENAIYTRGGFSFLIHYHDDSLISGNHAVTLTIVPEPGPAVSLLGGIGLLLAVRRRRM